MRWRIQIDGLKEPLEVALLEMDGHRFKFRVGVEEVLLEDPDVSDYSIRLSDLNLSFETWTERKWRTSFGGQTFTLEPLPWGAASGSALREVRSEMPGRILKVLVKPGDRVKLNQPMLIIEAMKMENEIRASNEAVVKSIPIQQGQSIESGALLVEFEGAEVSV
jgi:biotin carboxyl carrier protein